MFFSHNRVAELLKEIWAVVRPDHPRELKDVKDAVQKIYGLMTSGRKDNEAADDESRFPDPFSSPP